MDIKTLEYMGERVDKARSLQERIKELNKKIDKLDKKPLKSISFSFSDDSFYTNSIPIMNDIKTAAINAYVNYRDVLQKELDEL